MRAVHLILWYFVVSLPAAIWFAREASVAGLNPWLWAVWSTLSVGAPIALTAGFARFTALAVDLSN